MNCGSKDIFKNAPCLMYVTHHDVTDLTNHWMVKNTKNFSVKKKILNCTSDETFSEIIVFQER